MHTNKHIRINCTQVWSHGWLCARARSKNEWEARWNNDNKTQRRRIIMHAIVMITSAANTNTGADARYFLREINVDDFLMNRHRRGGGKRRK